MKKIIAVMLAVLMALCVIGCDKKPQKTETGETVKRTTPLKYGINAHVFELRPVMDPSSTMDYIADMTSVLGVEYYRLSTAFDALLSVGEDDTLTFKEGQRQLIHSVIDKMSAAGIKQFVAVSDSWIYPYGYDVTTSGVIADPLIEPEMYLRCVKLMAKAWGMVVEEFPEITHVELMNEPDHPSGNSFTKQGHQWGADDNYRYPLTDVAHMVVDMLYYTRQEVRAVNPKVYIDTPGLTTHGEAYEFLNYMYEAIESGAHPTGTDTAIKDPDEYFDYINFHAYMNSMSIDDYFEHIDVFYKSCEKHGDAGKPAILTECGFTDNDNEGQEIINGENMTKILEMYEKKMPYLEAILLYVLNDYADYSVSSAEDNFGLFTSRGDPEKPSCPKPTAIAFYKYIHKTEDVSPLYKYCPELMPK